MDYPQKGELGGILFDHARRTRIGLPEAVFCEGKPEAALLSLFRRFPRGSGEAVLFTRLAPEIFAALPDEIRQGYDYDPISRTAIGDTLPRRERGKVAVVSAGAADAPVAREAARTLACLGISYNLFEDCGVAGLWRLAEKLQEINAHNAVIAVAGLEGALASVLGGLTPLPVFAVPTSVGYGVAKDGAAALTSMLASCAPGVAVFNIDNGYGAACAAARVVNQLAMW